MDLYNSQNMPLSLDNEIRTIQEKQLRGEKLNMSELLVLVRKDVGGRDHTIRKIGDYECKPNCCYRCVSEEVYQIYKQTGFILDQRRSDYIEGVNNQGIDWYLGGTMPSKKYGFIVIECPADKKYFKPTKDGGYGMSNDIYVRHMKSSPQNNPIPFSMITNVFDYKKIMQEQKEKFDLIRQQEMLKRASIREQQINSAIQHEEIEKTGFSR